MTQRHRFDFATALRRLHDGGRVTRAINLRSEFIFGGRITGLEAPGVTLPQRVTAAPCLFRCDEHGVVHAGWQPTAEDMLAHDWLELVGASWRAT